MALLIITTILWAFSFSLIGEYLAGHVDSYFSVLMRVGLAALVFLPFLRTRGQTFKTILLYMLVGAMQLGIMNNVHVPAGLLVNLAIWQEQPQWPSFIIGGTVILASLWVHRRWVAPRSAQTADGRRRGSALSE